MIGEPSYHMQWKHDLHKSFVTITKKSAHACKAHRESSKLKKKRHCSEISSSSSCSSRSPLPVHLRYKNWYVFCNEPVHIKITQQKLEKNAECQMI